MSLSGVRTSAYIVLPFASVPTIVSDSSGKLSSGSRRRARSGASLLFPFAGSILRGLNGSGSSNAL